MSASLGQMTTRTVDVERWEWTSRRDFTRVLHALHLGLGRPDFAEFDRTIDEISDWTMYTRAVEKVAGNSGLIVFLELDIGSVISRDPDAKPYRAVRIIAGNPVTMESMTRSSPAAGALAPITVLLFETADGVHLRYHRQQQCCRRALRGGGDSRPASRRVGY